MEKYGRHLVVSGSVQGVGYRYFCASAARSLGLTGYVMNLPDGSVEIEVFGEENDIGLFTEEIKGSDKGFAVDSVKESAAVDEKKYGDFYILHYPG